MKVYREVKLWSEGRRLSVEKKIYAIGITDLPLSEYELEKMNTLFDYHRVDNIPEGGNVYMVDKMIVDADYPVLNNTPGKMQRGQMVVVYHLVFCALRGQLGGRAYDIRKINRIN